MICVAVQFLNYYSNVFNLNETFMADINNRSETCGYNSFMETALTFPPTGPIPYTINASAPGCDVQNDIFSAAIYINPCFVRSLTKNSLLHYD
jgi:carboxypeptidase D